MENREVVPVEEKRNPDYEKKIGNTCYQVNYYFDQNTKATMQDKVLKVMKAELELEAGKAGG